MVLFLLFLLAKVSVGQFECDVCLEVGSPGCPDGPDGCAYTKDGDPDTWCFGEGSYPASATCPAAQTTTSELPITSSFPPSTSSVFSSTASPQASPTSEFSSSIP